MCWKYLLTRKKLLPPPFIVFMHIFIYSLNKDLKNENGFLRRPNKLLRKDEKRKAEEKGKDIPN